MGIGLILGVMLMIGYKSTIGLSDEQIESAGIDPSTVEKEEYYDPTKDFFDNEEVDGDDK